MFEYAKKKISSIFKNHEIIECTIGESNSGVYKVITPLRNYYLKIQRINVKEKLEVEASIYGWLKNKKIKIPEIKYYEKDNLYEYLVLTEIQGLPSFDMVLRKNKKRIIEILASTLIDIHNIKIDNCRFKRKKELQLMRALYPPACARPRLPALMPHFLFWVFNFLFFI
jgi:aminoglycoside phosphotransferase